MSWIAYLLSHQPQYLKNIVLGDKQQEIIWVQWYKMHLILVTQWKGEREMKTNSCDGHFSCGTNQLQLEGRFNAIYPTSELLSSYFLLAKLVKLKYLFSFPPAPLAHKQLGFRWSNKPLSSGVGVPQDPIPFSPPSPADPLTFSICSFSWQALGGRRDLLLGCMHLSCFFLVS